MYRMILLGAVSLAALALSSPAFATVSNLQGGGSTLAQYDYVTEFSLFNAAYPNFQFNNSDWSASLGKPNQNYYWFSGSGAGQLAFLNNDLSCDKDKVLGIGNSSNCDPAPGGANAVTYGASDATLSSTQISGWASDTYGQAVSGDLIQLPSMGVGIAIPVNNASFTKNGYMALSDNDLCGIFSGKITDWSQLATANGGDVGPQLTPGQITVVYRNDGSGTSFLFTNHLAHVCTTGAASNAAIPFFATQKFWELYNGVGSTNNVIAGHCGNTGACFVGEKGSNGIADFLETGSGSGGSTITPIASGITYLTPDFTSYYYNTTDAVLDGGAGKSKLLIASVLAGKVPQLPSTAAILTGLTHPGAGASFITPPTGAANVKDPNQWVSLIPLVTSGYPLVGYTTLDFAQCYKSHAIANAVKAFIKHHYQTLSYNLVQKNNGFEPIPAAFRTGIEASITSNSSGYGADIGDTAACAGIGR